MYRSPEVTSYTGEELRDLMGPAETQYLDSCEMEATPNPAAIGQNIGMCFNYACAPEFTRFLLVWDLSAFTEIQRSDPDWIDNAQRQTFCHPAGLFQFNAPGTHHFRIELEDGSGSTVGDPMEFDLTVL